MTNFKDGKNNCSEQNTSEYIEVRWKLMQYDNG